MRSLVSIFAAILILISLYQLSFTWFVNKHEKAIEEKARKYVSAIPTPEQKYPGNNELQAAYRDSLAEIKKDRVRQLQDSTRNEKITWWGHTYQKAKESELLLGLDLQGGINVTMDVALDGLIRGLSNNPQDANLKKAIEEALKRKVNSDADFITLFSQSFRDVNPGAKMAPLFANSSRNKLKIDASDESVIAYIRDQANAAMKQTYDVLTKRIDKFGVAQPNISLDENKGIITVELAGATDPERVRKYLQSSANLQFFEVYNIGELDKSLEAADKELALLLKGGDTSKAAVIDTTKSAAAGDTTNKSLADVLKGNKDTSKTAMAAKSAEEVRKDHPLLASISFVTPQDANKDGRPEFAPYLGFVPTKDTNLVSSYLHNPAVTNNMPGDVKFLYGMPEKDKDGKELDFVPLYAIKKQQGTEKAKLEGEYITDAFQDFNSLTNQVTVNMVMNKQGEKIWAKMTGDNVGRAIAIVLDDIVYSAPNVNEPITGGNSQISGSFSVQEGQDLSNILKSGKLDAPAKIVQETVVGPTLGQEAVKGGTLAFIIAFAIIFVLMLVYYNTAGWVANIALILNLLFTIGVLSALNATLTAPGIAGLVLTIGMAVDTNVIIFERIKDELTRGKSYQQAVNDGYRRSLAPVLDGHITTLLTAIILFYFGLGPVLGFATTQILGILLSLFCGILVSRLITDFYTNKNRHFNYFTNLSRSIFKHAKYNFVQYRKVTYIISGVVLLLGIAAIFNGFNEGVEFSGGRSYIVKFPNAVKQQEVGDALDKVFGKYPVIKTYGGPTQLDITTDYMVEQTSPEADAKVQATLFEGLKPFLPANTTPEVFNTKYKQASKRVDPTISDDLKAGAKWATFWSLLAIALYIFIRFRDWRYSLGTIVALLHDVLVTLAVFSFFKNIVPFPLEIDQHFIAAILTVIGFSMNDTVIVFDRVRENSHLMKGASKAEIINKSINDTLTRTIMTSVTVFLTILVLFLVGGEVTKGFAFAMLIGVFTGCYSSIFVAAPILVDFAKDRPLGESKIETATSSTTNNTAVAKG
ncbi:protein translocase subunit SecDF [Flavihumibacter petaseus]|uniref:Multifunctional fusion protein n=1 Tax=Flavihumibacter petaseus NBRC 106054 TaxID=1220578 RepID=A0A0E9N2R9_9BACT|nr:protein translocase subunit SecDF [Flavihumibacter petaseus]GAO44307.1 preprotein translocase subunit SecD/F [Flavihumibacter petaseus NBRC 106054]